MVHFSFAESGFFNMHMPHVQSGVGAEACEALGAGRGDSQTVHFSFAESGFLSIHRSHVQSAAGAVVFAVGFDELAAVKSKVKALVGRVRAADLAALSTSERGISTMKTNAGSDDDAISSALFCAAVKVVLLLRVTEELEDWVMVAKVEFSISASGSAGLDGVSLKTGAFIDFGVCTGTGDCAVCELDEEAKDGIGRAGEAISGALNAGGWKGSGILGKGLDVWVVDAAGAGGGVGDLSRSSSDESSISSSTSIASREGDGV